MTDQVNEAVAWLYTYPHDGESDHCLSASRLLPSWVAAKGATEQPLCTPPARGVVDDEKALADFTEYFARNYPGDRGGTLICDPKWHAPRIFRAAKHALQAAAQPAVPSVPEAEEVDADAVMAIIDKWMISYDHIGTGSARSGQISEREWEEDRAKLLELLAATPKDQPAPRPKQREVARIGDMHQADALRVGLDGDGDAYVCCTGDGVEFCTTGTGGGKSPRTHEALIALMVAMEADNAETPTRDWWARRSAAKDQPAQGVDGEG